MEAYFAAKLRLFAELLPQGGTAVLNADAPEARGAARIACAARCHRVIDLRPQAARDLRLVPTAARRPTASASLVELLARSARA